MAQAFPRTRRAPKSNPTARALAITIFTTVMAGAAFWTVNSTLDQMTWNDCQAGIQRACDAIQK